MGQTLLDKVNMLIVEDRAKQLQLNQVHKIYKGDSPDYMHDNFKRLRDSHSICTRGWYHNFFLPKAEKDAAKSFYFTAIKSWNSLPDCIKSIEGNDEFKKRVKLHLRKVARDKEKSPVVT